ncbi:MAG: hypothetical protein FJ222_07215 [Lentisphaerae bacterium]|nr:hypothetical protein [Lentisphaerota bacterium]
MRTGILAAAMAAGCVAITAVSQSIPDKAVEIQNPAWTMTYGAEVRFRFDDFVQVPGRWNARPSKDVVYTRTRTRGWMEAAYGDCALYLRAANEWRHYFVSPSAKDPNSYHWADEAYVDNLYLTLSGLDLMDHDTQLRIGRQDLKFGAGRVFADATPGDGSRSFFADAIRATIKTAEKSRIDLFYAYLHTENELTLGDQDRLLTQWGVEQAVGAYYVNGENKQVPFKAYYVGVFGQTAMDRLNTCGMRVLPAFGDHVKGELETAYQFGEWQSERNISAYMVYGGVTGDLASQHPCKPYAGAAVYLLSGDDGQGDDSAWKPALARGDTQMSELIYRSRPEQWSNLIFPHVELGIAMSKDHKARLLTGMLYYDEKPVGATSREQGFFTMLRYDFPLVKNLFGTRGEIKGALLGEALIPGDLYTQNDETAYCFRFELNAAY